jgi:hypothetical protein
MIAPIWPDVKPLAVVVRFWGYTRLSISAIWRVHLPVRRKRFLRNVARQVPQSRGERGASRASPVSCGRLGLPQRVCHECQTKSGLYLRNFFEGKRYRTVIVTVSMSRPTNSKSYV